MLWRKIIIEFNQKIDDLKKLRLNSLQFADKGLEISRKTLLKMRNSIESSDFTSTKEEIFFFKQIKIEPLKYLIYLSELRSTELIIPKIGIKQQRKHLEKEVNKVNAFYVRNIDFILYMKQGLSEMDKVYFTRKHQYSGIMVKSPPYFKDSKFNTSHDYVWAKINAMGLYSVYLQEKITKLKNSHSNNSNFLWTGSYAAFVELGYGLKEMGCINNGTADVKEIFEVLGGFLGVPRGNHSRTYNELKSRKGSQIKFFKEAGEKLLKKMESEDGLEGER